MKLFEIHQKSAPPEYVAPVERVTWMAANNRLIRERLEVKGKWKMLKNGSAWRSQADIAGTENETKEMICDKEGKQRHGSLQHKSDITITSDKQNHPNAHIMQDLKFLWRWMPILRCSEFRLYAENEVGGFFFFESWEPPTRLRIIITF